MEPGSSTSRRSTALRTKRSTTGRLISRFSFTAWEGVEADLRGIDLRYFRFADYGFPEFYQVVLACDREWLERDPDAARRFVDATVKGFEFGVEDPDAAADILVAENPGVFDANPDLPRASQRYLVDEEISRRRGRVGSAGRHPSDGGTIRSSSSTRASWLMPRGIL